MPDQDPSEPRTVILPPLDAGDGEKASARPQLVCIDAPPGSGTQAGRAYSLTSGGVNTIGREAANNIVLPLDLISRRHATIHQEDGNWFITDLQSLNGTYLNGTKIDKQTLQPGDKIQLSGITLGFQLGATSETMLRQMGPIGASSPPPPPPPAAAPPQKNQMLIGLKVAVIIAIAAAGAGAYLYLANS